ncbi:hypothetical protein [Bacteroides fragilis]
MDGVKIGFRNLWGQVAMALVLLSSMGGCTGKRLPPDRETWSSG